MQGWSQIEQTIRPFGPLFWDDQFLLLAIVMRIDTILVNVLWQFKFEYNRGSVNEEANHKDCCVLWVLLEDKFIA